MAKKVTTIPPVSAAKTAAPEPAKVKTPILFMFSKANYMIMLLGLAVIILGFLLMLGVNNTDPTATAFQEDIYSFRRITLAPITVMIGFAIEIVAIWYIPKKSE